MRDIRSPESERGAPPRRHVRRRRGGGGVPPTRHPVARGRGRVQPRRRGHRHRAEGDVPLHRHGGREVALRPEFTASVCRAFVQHRPATPWKVWLAGPNFRYERPQRGRYRQFDQVDLEVLGSDDPYVDVETIVLGWRFLEALGLRQVELLLNSLGDGDERARYVDALRAYLERNADALSAQSRETLAAQPVARARLEAGRGRRAARGRADDRRLLRRGFGRTLRHRDERLGPRRHSVPDRPGPRARPRLLRPHDIRVRRRHTRQRPERTWRRRAVRRARRGAGRTADARDRLRPRCRAHPHRLRRRGCVRAPVDESGRVRGRHHGRPGGAPHRRRAPRCGGWRSSGGSTGGA